MKSKVLTAIGLAAVLLTAFAFGAYAGGQKDTGAAAGATGNAAFDAWCAEVKKSLGGQQIKIAIATDPSFDAMKKMMPEFEQRTGIKVQWDEMEETALMNKLLLEVAAGKTDYDGTLSYTEWIPMFEKAGMVEPLEGWLADKTKTPAWYEADDVLPAYRNALSMKGHQYAAPYKGETIFIMYRKDLFEQLKLPVPATYDQLLQDAKAISEKGSLGGVTMRTRLGWEATYMWSPFIFPFGGKMIDKKTNKPAFDQKGTIESLKYFVNLCKYGPPGIENFSWPESSEAFLQGKAGIMVETTVFASLCENPELGVVAGKTGYAKMPKGPAGAFSGVWAGGLCVFKDSKAKEAVWATLLYFTGKPVMKQYIELGGTPFRSSTLQDPGYQQKYPYYKTILETLQQAADLNKTGYEVVLMDERWSPLSEMMGTEISRAVSGEITAEAACANMQTKALDIWK